MINQRLQLGEPPKDQGILNIFPTEFHAIAQIQVARKGLTTREYRLRSAEVNP